MNLFLRLLVPTAMAVTGAGCVAEPASMNNPEPMFQWIDRPWEYRYLLQVVSTRKQNHFAEMAVEDKQKGVASRDVFGYFKPTLVLNVPASSTDSEDALSVTRIDVAKDRTVTTPNTADIKLAARLNRIEHIVLAPTEVQPKFLIDFGDFFMGTFSASDLRYSPTICNTIFGDSLRPDEPGRYAIGSDPAGSRGYFGCREWAAQLYARDRPYIDVTSYEMEEDYMQDTIKAGKRKGKYPLIPVTYVRPFIGFARYDDPLKPVIGNHKGTWACFNDCPDGEAPGIIPDIKAWAAKHNWAVPKKPKNVREFMDKKPDATDLME